MPKITFIALNGTQHSVEVEAGISVMEAARNNGVPGIEAECGGARACATCHVYFEKHWLAVTGSAEGEELELMEFASDVREGSRLSCQVTITTEMDGLIIGLPESQALS